MKKQKYQRAWDKEGQFRGVDLEVVAQVDQDEGRSFNIRFSLPQEDGTLLSAPVLHFKNMKEMDTLYKYIKGLVKELRKGHAYHDYDAGTIRK